MDNQQESFLEEYKILREFPKYEVSNYGNIRNIHTKILKYVHKHSTGYVLVQFKKDRKTYTRKMHRMVAELFVKNSTGLPTADLVVKHKDNNKSNNYFKNLEWDTHAGNMEDAYEDNLIPSLKGEKNGRSKLTDKTVNEICLDYENGMRPYEVREKYGVSKQQAEKIHAGHSWTHISSNYNIKAIKKESSTTRT